jgi:hypothetical protein
LTRAEIRVSRVLRSMLAVRPGAGLAFDFALVLAMGLGSLLAAL